MNGSVCGWSALLLSRNSIVSGLPFGSIHRRTVALAPRCEQEVVGLLEQLAVGP